MIQATRLWPLNAIPTGRNQDYLEKWLIPGLGKKLNIEPRTSYTLESEEEQARQRTQELTRRGNKMFTIGSSIRKVNTLDGKTSYLLQFMNSQ